MLIQSVGKDLISFKDTAFPIIVNAERRAGNEKSFFHEEIEIKYVLSGTVTTMIDTEMVSAEKGDIIFFNPYEVHSNVVIDSQEGSYHLLVIGLDFFGSQGLADIDLRNIFMHNKVRFNNLIKNKRAAAIIKAVVLEMTEQKKYYKSAVKALLQELFIILQREEISAEEGKTSEDERVRMYSSVEPAVQEIRDNYSKKISGDKLAALCNMSRYHFCRSFKKIMGMTAVQYQTQCRLKIAEILLKNGDKTVSEIAHETGFEDEAYFSRCYKKNKGVSPKTARAILSK